LTSLADKPTGSKESFSKDKAVAGKKEAFDPFVPPFETGLFINHLNDSHSLLFNKFCICNEHVLVVTKDF